MRKIQNPRNSFGRGCRRR